MNEKLTDRNVLDDVLLTFLDGPMTPLPYDLSLVFWDPIFSDKGTVGLIYLVLPGLAWQYEFLAVYGLGLSAQMSQWAWITGSQSLSHLCFKQWSADISCQTPSQAPGIPNSCSPI